jgi:hypothetical protein
MAMLTSNLLIQVTGRVSFQKNEHPNVNVPRQITLAKTLDVAGLALGEKKPGSCHVQLWHICKLLPYNQLAKGLMDVFHTP